MFAVEVLMQAVIVAFAILQEKRCRPELAGVMTACEERFVVFRISDVEAHCLVPAVGDWLKARIKQWTQFPDRRRQRIGKIFVFAAAKAMTAHYDSAAKQMIVGIEHGERAAFFSREQALQDGATLRIEIGGHLSPIDRCDAGGNIRLGSKNNGLYGCFHAATLANSDRYGHPIYGSTPHIIARRVIPSPAA